MPNIRALIIPQRHCFLSKKSQKKTRKAKKKRKFKHIIKVERSEISILFRKGYSLRDIAKTLKRNVSSISREIKYNTTNEGYSPAKANHKAYVKRKYSKYQGMKVVENLSLRTYIEEYIREDWSPEEISGRIQNKDRHIKYISPKGIYKFIYSVRGLVEFILIDTFLDIGER